MSHLTRTELDANLTKLYGQGCNAHPSVQIFSRHSREAKVSHLTKDMLDDARDVRHMRNASLFIVRRGALADRPYIAQNWHTGEEHSFSSIGKLKVFLGASSN